MTKIKTNNILLIFANLIIWFIVSFLLFLIFSIDNVFAKELTIPDNFFTKLNPWLGSSYGQFNFSNYATWSGYSFQYHKSSVYLDAYINQDYISSIENGSNIKFVFRFGAIDSADSNFSTDLIDGFFTMSTFYIRYDDRSSEMCTPSYYSDTSFLIECYISNFSTDINNFRIFFSLYPENLEYQTKKYNLYIDFKSVDLQWDGTYSQPVSPGGNSNTGIDYSSRFDDIYNSINNSNVDTSNFENWFNNFQTDGHGLTSVITAPLNFIYNLNNATCVPIDFTLFNKTFSIPCMTSIYNKYIPNIILIYQIAISGFISYYILLDLFRIVKGFKDPKEDRIEVLNL